MKCVFSVVFCTASLRLASSAGRPLVRDISDFKVIGQGLYHALPPTWTDFRYRNSRVGMRCHPEKPKQTCGTQLVCRKKLCMHCQDDSECPDHHTCLMRLGGKNICQRKRSKVWNEVFTDPFELLCSFLIFVFSALASAAGMGGGGVFVPLLIMLSGLSAPVAVPISQAMIFMSSIVNLSVMLAQHHPDSTERSKIDYSCVVLLEPMLCAGVTLGVLIHQLSPQWLLVVLLCATLLLALWRSLRKGLQQREAEARLVIVNPDEPHPLYASTYFEDFRKYTDDNFKSIRVIIVIWFVVFAFSLHNLAVCSVWYLMYLAVMMLTLVCITFFVGRYVLVNDNPRAEPASVFSVRAPRGGNEAEVDAGALEGADKAENGSKSSDKQVYLYALVSLGAGLMGGLLGLGGGMLMSPVLLELGMHSEVVQATTALFVFLSSSLATVQYALVAAEPLALDYVAWYGGIAVIATFLGQWACNTYVQRYKRYSVITFSIVAVTGCSLVALAYVGIKQVARDIESGKHMGFSVERLCSGDGLGIIAVDVMPEHDGLDGLDEPAAPWEGDPIDGWGVEYVPGND